SCAPGARSTCSSTRPTMSFNIPKNKTLTRIDTLVYQTGAGGLRFLEEAYLELISSSLKTCRTSMVIGVRTSQPVQSHRDLAERVLADRRHKVLYTVMQMNGSRGYKRTWRNAGCSSAGFRGWERKTSGRTAA